MVYYSAIYSIRGIGVVLKWPKRPIFSFITIKCIEIKHLFAKIFGWCADTCTINSECIRMLCTGYFILNGIVKLIASPRSLFQYKMIKSVLISKQRWTLWLRWHFAIWMLKSVIQNHENHAKNKTTRNSDHTCVLIPFFLIPCHIICVI